MPRPSALRPLVAVMPLALVLLAAGPRPAGADDLTIRDLLQTEFRDMSAELGIAISAFQLRPAGVLGFPRFDVGAEMTVVDINDNRTYWQRAFDDAPAFLPVPKLHASVGVPLGIELGALYSKVPGTNIELWGAEAKWEVIEGGLVTPAVALRGAYTSLEGVDELEMSTRSIDASVSKGFGPLTPYAGLGRVWIEAEPRDVPLLQDESHTEDRLFAGVRFRMLLLSFVGQVDWSRVPAYSFRMNVSF